MNKMEFYENNFETRFFRFDKFYETNDMRLVWPFLDMFFEIRRLHDILELVGVKFCTFDGESVNSV